MTNGKLPQQEEKKEGVSIQLVILMVILILGFLVIVTKSIGLF